MTAVVMLSWEYPPLMVGGLARHVDALAGELVRLGLEVHVLTRALPGLPPDRMEANGVHVHRVLPYFQEPVDFRLWVCHLNFALMEAGVRLLRELKPPVILHAHDWLVAYAARGLKGLSGLPLVATIHATEHGRHGGIHETGQQYINDIEWWLTYEASHVIVCSQAMRSELSHLFAVPADKLHVIVNGVAVTAGIEIPVFPSALQTGGDSERLLFHVGRLVPEKGAMTLVEAMPWILREHPTQLIIAGTGPCAQSLQRRVLELGLADRVHLTGWADDAMVQGWLRQADVAVFPSLYEPFGIVALEAMAAGTPLVVSAVGGLSEIVQHGVNGLKAPPGDPPALALQVERLLADRGFASRLAARAYQDVLERYNWGKIAAETTAVYEAVLGEAQMEPAKMEPAQMEPAPFENIRPPFSGETPGRYTI